MILIQLAVAVQPGVDPNSGQWPSDGEYLQNLEIQLTRKICSLISLPKCTIQCFASSLPSLRIEGINSRVFLLEESAALGYTRSMSVGAPTSTPGVGTSGPGIDYLGSTSYSYNHSAPFLQAASSESSFKIFEKRKK